MDTNRVTNGRPVAPARTVGYNLAPMSPVRVRSGTKIGLLWRWLPLLVALLVLAACGEATPTPFPTAPRATRIPVTPTKLAMRHYTNDDAGFSLELPPDWQVAEQGMTVLGRSYLVGPDPLGPGPASSALFVSRAAGLSAAGAAAALACDGCAAEPELEAATIGETEGQRALLGEPLAVEWFFVEHEEWLIFFTLHDPETLETRADLVATFRLEEPEATPTPTMDAEATRSAATPPPTPTPLPTTVPAPEAVAGWQTVTVDGAAISFEVPERWQTVAGTAWAPDGLSPLRLGFSWDDTAAEPADALPPGAIVASEPLTLTWASGISATLQTGDSWERHAVLQVGLRSYDFYASGLAQQSLESLQPLLAHVVDSVVLHDQLLYLDDPVAAAVAWFDGVLRDAGGQAALPYMSAALKEQLDPGQSPLVLLALPEPPSVYQLEVAGEPGRTLDLQANLTLPGGAETTRLLRLVFDQPTGWRLDEIIVPEEE